MQADLLGQFQSPLSSTAIDMAAAQTVLAAPCISQAAPAARRKLPSSAAQPSCAACGCSSVLSPAFKNRFRNPLQTTNAQAPQSVSRPSQSRRRCIVRAVEKEENVPSWAKPGSEEVPPWAKEDSSGFQKEGPTELPFGLYLLFSVFTAIAAVSWSHIRRHIALQFHALHHQRRFCDWQPYKEFVGGNLEGQDAAETCRNERQSTYSATV